MAQTKKRRPRKHRGTQAGTIERAGRTGRGQIKKDSRQIARDRRQERLDREPTWRSALNRSALAAAVFGLLVVVLFRRPVAAGLTLAAVMVLVYWPMSFYTDRFLWRRRKRKRTGGGR
jgi:hypothetical protein